MSKVRFDGKRDYPFAVRDGSEYRLTANLDVGTIVIGRRLGFLSPPVVVKVDGYRINARRKMRIRRNARASA